MRIYDEFQHSIQSFTIDDAEYMCSKNDDGLWDFWEYMKDIESLYIKYLFYNGRSADEYCMQQSEQY